MLLLTLIFGIVLLPKAHTLKCYECIPEPPGTCTDTTTTCPFVGQQCAAQKLISYAGGSKVLDTDTKACALAEECVDASVNFGISKTVIATKCCNTDLCNSKTVPAPSPSSPNGKQCFFCDGQTCTGILKCEGNEDHCISSTVTAGDQKVSLKGCASKSACTTSAYQQISRATGVDISCCQGDLCNSASSTSAVLLLLVAPLVSLVMFS